MKKKARVTRKGLHKGKEGPPQDSRQRVTEDAPVQAKSAQEESVSAQPIATPETVSDVTFSEPEKGLFVAEVLYEVSRLLATAGYPPVKATSRVLKFDEMERMDFRVAVTTGVRKIEVVAHHYSWDNFLELSGENGRVWLLDKQQKRLHNLRQKLPWGKGILRILMARGIVELLRGTAAVPQGISVSAGHRPDPDVVALVRSLRKLKGVCQYPWFHPSEDYWDVMDGIELVLVM